MDYFEAIEYFFSRLPMFSKEGKKALKPKLDNILHLVKTLDIDISSQSFIHVAGTNGKGSTCHLLAACLQKAGYKVGLFTSPHLVDLRERVKINGEMISQETVMSFVEKIQPFMETFEPSYFEMNVALAFYAFQAYNVDIVVLETGLGGRWDSTNIVTPLLSIITSIDYDHTDILGDTLAKIAYEKAGIIKENVPVLIGKKHPETDKVFIDEALVKGSTIYFAEDFFVPMHVGENPARSMTHQYKHFFEIYNQQKHLLKTDLLGDYQWDNIRTAWAAIRILQQQDIQVTDAHFISAIQEVKYLTAFRGRWDVYRPNIVLDVGHNPEGIQAIVKNIQHVDKKLLIVYGSVKDKDVRKSVSLLPRQAYYFLTQAQIPRALDVASLKDIFIENGIENTSTYSTVASAIDKALTEIDEDSLLLIIGSFFIVGEAYQYLDKLK